MKQFRKNIIEKNINELGFLKKFKDLYLEEYGSEDEEFTPVDFAYEQLDYDKYKKLEKMVIDPNQRNKPYVEWKVKKLIENFFEYLEKMEEREND